MHPMHAGSFCGCMLFLIVVMLCTCIKLLPLATYNYVDHTSKMHIPLFVFFVGEAKYHGIRSRFLAVYTAIVEPAGDMIA